MKKKRRTTAFCAILISIIIAASSFGACAEDVSEYEPFIRIDRDDAEAYNRGLDNLRIITGDMYEFRELGEQYGIPSDFIPDETGLDMLDVSASAQFSDWQLTELANQLRKVAGEKKIVILDLRRESHALLNGRPFSICGLHNWSNLGLSTEEIMDDEEQFFSSLVGTTLEAHPKHGDEPGKPYEYEIESFLSERELVEDAGLDYFRLPAKDHCWPDPECIDQFIDLIKEVGIDNLWLHIHCQAGKGRTGSFLVMYDKMKNPDVPIKEIAIRQAMLGASYMLYTENSDSWRAPLYEEKARMTYLFEDYVNENKDTNFELSWSEWLEEQLFDEAA